MKNARKVQALVNDFAAIKRNHYLPGTHENESDIHHSFSVAILAWYINEKLNLGLNTEKILKYALVHDLVEVYAGDINSYASEQVREAKKTTEAASLVRLTAEFGGLFPDLIDYVTAYELRAEPEAHFVWTVDKAQALVQGKEDGYRPFYKQGITSEMVKNVHGGHSVHAYQPAQAYYQAILDEFLSEYDDTKISPDGKVNQKSKPARQ